MPTATDNVIVMTHSGGSLTAFLDEFFVLFLVILVVTFVEEWIVTNLAVLGPIVVLCSALIVSKRVDVILLVMLNVVVVVLVVVIGVILMVSMSVVIVIVPSSVFDGAASFFFVLFFVETDCVLLFVFVVVDARIVFAADVLDTNSKLVVNVM